LSTGAIASAAGLAISYKYDLPTGPMVVCTFGLVLLLAAAIRKLVLPTPPTEPLHPAVEPGGD
jgi:ABC-type Mn2+/Zn2+ transport system permease subunit